MPGPRVAWGVIALAGVTLSQYIFGWDLGIDELWVKGIVTAGTVYPGRMAPITAICSLFAAGALFLGEGRSSKSVGISLLTAVGLCAVGTSVVFGYFLQLPTTFWWGRASMMAQHSAVGFTLLGLGLYAHAYRQLSRRKMTLFPWMVVSLALALLLVTVGLWQALAVLRWKDTQRVVENEARVALDALWADLQHQTAFLVRMSERWAVRGGIPEDEWKQEARTHFSDLSGMHALQLLNSEGGVRWSVIEEGYNEGQVGRSDLFGKGARPALQAALSTGASFTSPRTISFPGTKGFLTIVPISRHGQRDGAIVGVYRLDKWLNTIFSREGFQNYGVAVVHEGRTVYQRTQDLFPGEARWRAERELALDGLKLRIQVWPDRQLKASLGSPLPEIVLVFGLLMSALLTWTFSLMRSIRLQGLALKEANGILLEKNRKLLRTEESLQTTTRLQQAILEGRVIRSFPLMLEA